jgi:hypothetical protein
MFPLKPITRSGVSAALAKAERYRLLNEPLAAESICLDVLEVDPANQDALTMLLLARTDQLAETMAAGVARARECLSRLAGDYHRAYYTGLIAERYGKALLRSGGPASGPMAYDALREAMVWYERAAALHPPDDDEALLRWNTCARVLNANPNLAPRAEEAYQPALGD